MWGTDAVSNVFVVAIAIVGAMHFPSLLRRNGVPYPINELDDGASENVASAGQGSPGRQNRPADFAESDPEPVSLAPAGIAKFVSWVVVVGIRAIGRPWINGPSIE